MIRAIRLEQIAEQWPSFEEQLKYFRAKVLTTDQDIDKTEMEIILALLRALNVRAIVEYEPCGGVISDSALANGVVDLAVMLARYKKDQPPQLQLISEAAFVSDEFFANGQAQLIIEQDYCIRPPEARAAIINAIDPDNVVHASIHALIGLPDLIIWVARKEKLRQAIYSVINSLGIEVYAIENTKVIFALKAIRRVDDARGGQSPGQSRGIQAKIRDLLRRIMGRLCGQGG